jgi:energy-coupling factor transporter ATP-binding protein EcfA2
MIRFENVTITYDGSTEPTLRGVDLVVPEGELCLVAGRTGSGKSTLLGAINGLVPHFTGGRLAGRVTVDGLDTATHPPRDLASVVGVVGQDPLAGFVTDTVEEELAYCMEQQAVPPEVMRRRVEETLDLLGIADLRGRALRSLSGGQQQRVAIGSVLTAHPKVLVLDEPTSALDPAAAEEVLAAITRLVHDLGTTVVVAEHRMERVVQYADRILLVDHGAVVAGAPAEVMRTSPVAPPVVELGRLAGWSPLPLSVRDARRAAEPLRAQLAAWSTGPARGPRVTPGPQGLQGLQGPQGPQGPQLTARGVTVRYGDTVAVRELDLTLRAGEVVALMGRNGSGKSSLLWALQGSGRRQAGSVDVAGHETRSLGSREARGLVGLVPQTASDLLYLETVADECRQGDREAGVAEGSCWALLIRLAPDIEPARHPRDLSEGQRLALVLAVQLIAAPRVMLLDEPTRGLDYGAKAALAQILDLLCAEGKAVVVSTHDVEFVAGVADRVVVLAEGEIVTDGAAIEVLAGSPSFAPQVAKILAPQPWLTVAQVHTALPDLIPMSR